MNDNKTRATLIKYFPWIFFALFTYLISYKLFGGTIMTGDFGYFWPNSSIDAYSTWNTAYLGFSKASTMFALQVLTFIPYLFSKLGFSNEAISYFHNYGLVYACSLVYFFIVKRISKNTLLAYFAGLFIILNNFVLEHFLVWPGYIFYSFISYGITLYICYEVHLHGLNWRKVILIVLLSFLHLHPFFFIINLLFLFIFTTYYIIGNFKSFSKKQAIHVIIIFVGIIAVQLYWLLPFIYNIFLSSAGQVYNGNQFSILSGYLQAGKYINLFSLYHYPGTLGIKMHGGLLQYFWYFYLLFMVVFLLMKNKYKNIGWNIFLFFNLLFFLNLALGPTSNLTGGIWMYLYNNLPAFGFFRSFTRFIIVYPVFLVFLMAFLFRDWRGKYKTHVILLNIFFLVVSNLIFFTGDLGGFITSAKLPEEYIITNKKLFQNDPSQYNILALPNMPYETYTWFIANKKSKSGEFINQAAYFKELFFTKPVVYNRYAINLDSYNDLFKSFFKYDTEFVFPKDFNQIINTLNAKYIIVQKDLIDLTKENTPIFVEKYLNYLDHDDKLKLVEINDSFAIYLNKDYFPIIYSSNSYFSKVNDTEYIINLKGLRVTRNISFLQKYDEQWKLYPRVYSGYDWCDPIGYFNITNITECKQTKQSSANTLSFFWRKPIFDDTHKLVYDYANQWTIDPEYIKQNFDKSYYKENPDGSIDIELTLYFKPQSYFYLGLIISGTTLLSCFGYLAWDFVNRRRRGKLRNGKSQKKYEIGDEK